MENCAVCGKDIPDSSGAWYWVPKKTTGERQFNVCDTCDKHFKHTVMILEAKSAKMDREGA